MDSKPADTSFISVTGCQVGFNQTHFLDLNDDCVCEILRRLSIMDLGAMATVNKRISTIAKDLFQRLYACNRFTFATSTGRGSKVGKNLSLITTAFGKHITNIKIVIGYRNRRYNYIGQRNLMSLIESSCASNLRDLCIACTHIDSTLISQLLKIVQNVHHLTFYACPVRDDLNIHEKLIKKCSNLRTFTCCGVDLANATYDPTTVRKLWVRMYPFISGYDHIFRRHYQLNNLKELVVQCLMVSDHNACINFMDKMSNANRLESLWYGNNDLSERVCVSIAKMTYLKELRLNLSYDGSIDTNSVNILTPVLANLETLFLGSSLFDNNIIYDFIAKSPKLKSLYLLWNLHGEKSYKSEFAFNLIKIRKQTVAATKQFDVLTIYFISDSRTMGTYRNCFENNVRDNNYIRDVNLKWSDYCDAELWYSFPTFFARMAAEVPNRIKFVLRE